MEGAPPRLRLYRPGDETGVCRVAAECFEAAIRPYYSDEGRLAFGAYILPESIVERQHSGCQMVVAESDGEIVGVIELREFRHISMLFVAPCFQCCGIARRLLARAATLARRVHPELEVLTVFAAPNALEAYHHLGFCETGEEKCVSGIRFIPMQVVL